MASYAKRSDHLVNLVFRIRLQQFDSFNSIHKLRHKQDAPAWHTRLSQMRPCSDLHCIHGAAENVRIYNIAEYI